MKYCMLKCQNEVSFVNCFMLDTNPWRQHCTGAHWFSSDQGIRGSAQNKGSGVQHRPIRGEGFSSIRSREWSGFRIDQGFERFSSDPGVQLGPRGSGDQSRTRGSGIQFRPRDQGISLNQWFMGVQLQPRDQGFSLNQEDWEPRVGA